MSRGKGQLVYQWLKKQTVIKELLIIFALIFNWYSWTFISDNEELSLPEINWYSDYIFTLKNWLKNSMKMFSLLILYVDSRVSTTVISFNWVSFPSGKNMMEETCPVAFVKSSWNCLIFSFFSKWLNFECWKNPFSVEANSVRLRWFPNRVLWHK